MLNKVSIKQKMDLFSEHWQPKIVGAINDHEIKLAKFQGDFVWHKHDDTDEMFLVIAGSFTMKLRDGDVHLQEGDFIVIPAGVEHCPSAEKEVQVMLFELTNTLNTGDAQLNEKTVTKLDQI
jgi:mannose-6-phosphate isomerase-like protein (cupin superfamily)